MQTQHSMRIRAGRVLTNAGWLHNATVEVRADGRIGAVEHGGFDLDLGTAMLMPALVDSHVHGAIGLDAMDATPEALDGIACHLAQFGVGAFTPTTVTAAPADIEAALRQIRRSKESGTGGAEIIGSYLEGPYFAAACCGAHPVHLMRPIDLDELRHWHEVAGGTLNTVALAAELADSEPAIRWLTQQGVRCMIGHSDASYDQSTQAMQHGAVGVVHCFNGMRGLHHRDPGVVGAGLDHEGCHVELILDGVHVHPAAARIALRSAGRDNLILISDAMRATGMPDGDYVLGTISVRVRDGVARTESGGLAGSCMHLIDAVRNAMVWFKLPLESAWALASANPARALRRHDLGAIAPGMTASMVAITEDLDVLATWVQGKQIQFSV